MTLELLRSILGWCAIINMGILLWWFLFIIIARDWTYKVHGKFFKLSEEQFSTIHYTGMMIFKLCIFVFNIVPYFVLLILI